MNSRITLVTASVLCECGQQAAGQAATQDGVTIYGIMDTGLEYQRVSAGASGPATSSKQVATGAYSASRLGFRGSEDLGEGLRALFVLEHGLNSDDGTAANATFWNRKSIVGLAGRFRDHTLGRANTPAIGEQH